MKIYQYLANYDRLGPIVKNAFTKGFLLGYITASILIIIIFILSLFFK